MKEKNNIKVLSCPVLYSTARELLSEDSQALPVYSSGKRIIMIKVNIGSNEEFSPYRAVNSITVSVIKTNQSMLYSEIIAVCSQIHTKHFNKLCGQNVECRTYRAVNTLRLSYKNQPVDAVQ